MGSEHELAQLEGLLGELYTPTTPPSRRKDIELMLESFRNNADWAKCRFFLLTSHQPMTMYYIALVLHHTVVARWFRTAVEERNALRNFVWEFLLAHHERLDGAVLTKACQVLASIAKFDWPQSDPDYMLRIEATLQRGSSFRLLACTLFKTTLEDFVGSRLTSVPAARQERGATNTVPRTQPTHAIG
jgi:hypothetical protein